MTTRTDPLNVKQLAVLKWVRDGCADGVFDGTAHRVVARALYNRGLVVVKGNGPSWTARMTDAGTRYLEQGELPPPGSNTGRERPAKSRKHGPVDQLMASLAGAPDHRVLVSAADAGKYRRLAGMARNLDRIPDGMCIGFGHVRQADSFMVSVTLEPVPEWQTRLTDPLPVSSALRDPSDVVQAVMDSEDFPVAGDPRDRAFRLLEALVVGARASGMTVETGRKTRRGHGYAAGVQDEITFRIGQDRFELRFTQATLQRPHEPTEQELVRARRGHMFPDVDEVPDDDLGLVLDGPGARFWADRWKDAGEHRLESDLAQVLEEIRLRHGQLTEQRLRAQEREAQAEQARVERQRQQEIARERAMAAYVEHMVDEEARDQSRRWYEASQMRAYATEVRRRASTLGADDQEQAQVWAERIDVVADSLDPFPDRAVMPTEVAGPSESDLRRFMER